MTTYTVGLCGLIYLATSISFLIEAKYGFALAYFAYALANVGLIMADLKV